MDNNKLGLKITRTSFGSQGVFQINEDKNWTKNIWDIGKDIENIKNLDASSAVLMLTNIETGHVLIIASPIGGRMGDYISAWIHVPASINITGEELVKIVDVVKKEILATTRNDEELQKLFSKEYDPAPAIRAISKSHGEKFAYRYYGQETGYQLRELLNDMYQPYYKDYKSIFLLDKSSELKCLEGDDLSNQTVCSMILVEPPKQIDHFIPYIERQPFIRPIYAIEDDIIKIEWKKEGYESIQTETKVCRDIKWNYPTQDQYIKEFNTHIRVVDDLGQSVDKYELFIDRKFIEYNQTIIYIDEDKLNKVEVKIQAKGYELYTDKLDLSKYNNYNGLLNLIFQLRKKTYSHEFVLPLKNGEEYPIKTSTDKKQKTSPVKGYVLSSDNKKLKYNPYDRKFWIICLICSIILLGIGFVGGYFIFNNNEKPFDDISNQITDTTDTHDVTDSLSNKNQNNNTDDYSNNDKKAIEYLNKNNVWNRTAMENYDVLKGLWDAMNKRRFDDILSYKEKLKTSETFKEVIEAVKKNKGKTFNGNFNVNANDYDITIKPEGRNKGYIKSLEDANTKDVNTTSNNKENSKNTQQIFS